ncbi:MAG: indole-3-glycerol phosphate synthase TrpC [Pseudomonadota bacterium]
MSTVLDRIKSYKLEEIAAAKASRPMSAIAAEAAATATPRGFTQALRQKLRSGSYALIAEIKKASPSKGLIREDFDPGQLATAYRAGGAACLSVLTDTPSFQGSPDALRAARAAVDLPILRKDFMYDPYQVAEARAWGADCILIILASVSDMQAAELEAAAAEYGLDTLLEVHDADELDRAISLKSALLGINNRDLKTFETRLETTEDLATRVPADRVVISESGLFTPADLARMATCGVRSFLIGESLMRQPDVAQATQALLKDPVLEASA